MNFDEDAAVQAAETLLNRKFEPKAGFELRIDRRHTIRRPYGFVFFPQTDKFLKTGNRRDAAIGLGPVVFDAQAETLTSLGYDSDFEVVLKQYEADHYPETQ